MSPGIEDKPPVMAREEEGVMLRELIEGVDTYLEVPTRRIIAQKDFAELDIETFRPLRTVHLVLMNDGLVIASRRVKRRVDDPKHKYVLDAFFQLTDLAVVDVKDSEGHANVFRIMKYPDVFVYQANSSVDKASWMELIATATTEILRVSSKEAEPTLKVSLTSEETAVDSEAESNKTTIDDSSLHLSREWKDLLDAIDEFEALVAQRAFDPAVQLAKQCSHACSVVSSSD